MVDILPLKGLLYNQKKVEDLSKVISPPYDLIGPALEKKLKSVSPYNIANLILPQESGGMDKYRNASKILKTWIQDRILVLDSQPCFYLLEVLFKDRGSYKSIKGFIGLNKIEEYGKGKVLRHENTLPKPKQDRLSLLQHTQTNFGLIYTIYRDNTDLVAKLTEEQKPVVEVQPFYDPNLMFRVWRVSEEEPMACISNLMAPKTILIADGHHRYETSRIYRQKMKQQGITAADYILTLFVNSNQKDISIHPTHRLLKLKENADFHDLLKKIEMYFAIEKIGDQQSDLAAVLEKEAEKNQKSFVLYFEKKQVYLIRLKQGLTQVDQWNGLDVNILHHILIGKAIGQSNIEDISFTHEMDGVMKKTNQSRRHLGILLNAPGINQVEKLSEQGQLMPQKSTYFYPKPCTGLVMYQLDSFRGKRLL